jgi:hypothetical protein
MSKHQIIYALLAGTYLLLYLAKALNLYVPFLSDYLADLLCLPIVLSSIHFLMSGMRAVPKGFELSLAMIIAAIIAFSVVFEFVLPKINEKYTADPFDILAYFLGGINYYYYRRKYFGIHPPITLKR